MKKILSAFLLCLVAAASRCADQTPPSINTPQTLDTVLAGNGAGVQNSFRTLSAASITSGTLAVARGGTNIGSGTSGGILAFTGTGTIASSGLLAANAIVIGGGAGVAPSTTTTGTGVLTALGVNTGSAGAFVVFNGALGTPSSGALTNCTSIPAGQLTGSIADARLSANVPLLNATNTFSTGILNLQGSGREIHLDVATSIEAQLGSTSTAHFNLISGGHIGLCNHSSSDYIALYDDSSRTNQLVLFPGTGGMRINSATGGTEKATINSNGAVITYAGISTAGWGVPAIYGSNRVTAQTAAATLATYTCGAADGSFLVSANVNVTTATAHNFIVTCTYTDETNTSRVMTMALNSLAGTFLTLITNTAGAVPYESPAIHIRCKASTSITIATANGGGTNFTTVTYNGEGCIQQIK